MFTYNEEQREHGAADGLSRSTSPPGDFVEAIFENWESEFLQMGMYVVLTAFLFQRGSSESKPIDEPAPAGRGPARRTQRRRARPGRCGAAAGCCTLYEHSLAIAFFVAVLRVLRAARRWRGAGVQRGAARCTAQAAISAWRYLAHVAVLVRVVPELAERVPRGRGDRRAVDLPAPARVARVEAGRRPASGDQRVTTPCVLGNL